MEPLIGTELVLQSMNYWLTQTFNGVVLGMIYVLVALGLSIIFGMMGIVNFAHGDFLLVGTYVAWATTTATGNFLFGLITAPLVVVAIGVLFERTALRMIYDRDPVIQLLLTFGLAELLRGSVIHIWGQQGKSFPLPSWGSEQIDLILFNFPSYRLFVIVFSGVLVIATYVFLTRTDYGLIIRAGTMDREMVDMLGINIGNNFTLVFAIGALIAGMAGALIGPIQGASPTLGLAFLLPAFVIVIIGGMGSFKGSIIAGLGLGVIVTLTQISYGAASQVIMFVLMIIVLLVRPRGLFGREGVIE